jgi:protein-S-isoprenylcysteine O-methyltransferase Ste14
MLTIPLINFIITAIAFIFIVIAVIIDFLENHSNKNTQREKRSFVETGTMFLFFILFYLAIRFSVGKFETNINEALLWIISVICWLVILVGVYFNVYGRVLLGKNWANQIKIYKNHTLVRKGVYNIVRHPLYASLIWIFYACSILYANWLAFLLNTIIFLPMMYYRAKQEEKLLSEQFKNYKEYMKEVGMFFPKLKLR